MTQEGLSITLPVSLVERLLVALENLAPCAPAMLPAQPSGGSGDGLLTLEMAARWLGKSIRDVQRLVKAGKLRKVEGLGSRTTRFRPIDVRKLAASPEEKMMGRRRL